MWYGLHLLASVIYGMVLSTCDNDTFYMNYILCSCVINLRRSLIGIYYWPNTHLFEN